MRMEREGEPARVCVREVSGFSGRKGTGAASPWLSGPKAGRSNHSHFVSIILSSVMSLSSGCCFSFKVFKETPFSKIPAQLS